MALQHPVLGILAVAAGGLEGMGQTGDSLFTSIGSPCIPRHPPHHVHPHVIPSLDHFDGIHRLAHHPAHAGAADWRGGDVVQLAAVKNSAVIQEHPLSVEALLS